MIVERTQRLAGADGSVIQMLEAGGLVFRAVSGAASDYAGTRLTLEHCLSGE